MGEDLDDEPTLSVIIATFNGARKLGRALDSLAAQVSDEAFEIIVVNDGSTDDTAAVASRPGVTLVNLSPNGGKGHALNVGIDAARGRFLATMDDDCVPPPDWVQAMVDAWRAVDSEVTMIGGPISPLATDTFNRRFVEWGNPLHPQEAALHDKASVWTRIRMALLMPAPPEGVRTVYYVVGANMSIRTSAARAVGGFEEAPGIGGDEESIALRLRSRYGDATVRYFPQILMRHDFEPTIGDSLRRARTYGRANGRSWAKERDLPSMRPTPGVITVAVGLAAWASVGLGLFVLALAPPVLYRRWTTKLGTRKLEALAYPYAQVLTDLADNVGFVQGAVAELRRSKPTG